MGNGNNTGASPGKLACSMAMGRGIRTYGFQAGFVLNGTVMLFNALDCQENGLISLVGKTVKMRPERIPL